MPRSLLTDLRRAAPFLFPPQHGLPPGRFVMARMLALVALAAAYLARRPGGQLCWLGAGLLLVAVALEPVLARMRPRTEALQLPGLRPLPASPMRLVVPLSLGLLVLLAVVTAAAGSPWWWVAAGVVQAVVLALAAVAALRAYAGRASRARSVHTALADYAPELVLFTARGGALYQLQMWLPLLEQIGVRYAVVTREDGALAALATATSAPVVARVSWRDLDDVVVPSLRVVLYVNSVAANADFVTYRRPVHVYVGHGESDKALSRHPAHAMYDRIFVSGQAAIDRYASNGVVIPPSKFVMVGRPQNAAIEPPRAPVADLSAPTVLYAPTWAGYNEDTSYSSLPAAVQIVTALLRRPGAVVFRPHPFSRERAAEREHVRAVEELLAADAARTGRQHRYAASGTFASSANEADAMVADLSSVLTDFLASGKPMAVVAVGEAVTGFADRHAVAEAAYVVAGDLGNLEGVLDDLLTADPLRATRSRVLGYHIGGQDQADGTDGAPGADGAFRRAVLAELGRPGGRTG